MVFNTCRGLSSHEKYACQSLIKICPICGICFKNEEFLQKHLQNHNEETSDKAKMMENVRLFLRLQCRVYDCYKNFESKEMLVNHLMKVHKLKDEICIECGKDLKKVELLQNHVITEHQRDLPWKCPECGKKFKTRLRIERHMTTHTGIKKYHCNMCGCFFSVYNCLNQHRKSCRANSFRFACILCRKAFKDRQSVFYHMKEQCRYLKRTTETKKRNPKKGKAQARVSRKQVPSIPKAHGVSQDSAHTFARSHVLENDAQAKNNGTVAEELQDFNVTSSNDLLMKSDVAADDKPFFGISEFCLMEKAPTVALKEVDSRCYDESATMSAVSGTEMDGIDSQNTSLGSQEKELLERWLSIDESVPSNVSNLPEGFEDLPVQCNVMLSDDCPQARVQVEPCSVQKVDSTSSEFSSETGDLVTDENSSSDTTIKSELVQRQDSVQEGNIFNKLLADLLRESPKDSIIESQTLRMSSQCIRNAGRNVNDVNETIKNENLTIDETQEHYILPCIDDFMRDSELNKNTICDTFREELPGHTKTKSPQGELEDTLTNAKNCMPDHEDSSGRVDQKQYPFDLVAACGDNAAAQVSLSHAKEFTVSYEDISILTDTNKGLELYGSSEIQAGEARDSKLCKKAEVIPKDVCRNSKNFVAGKDDSEHFERPEVTFDTAATSVYLKTNTCFESLASEKESGKQQPKQGMIIVNDTAKPVSMANAGFENVAVEGDSGKCLTIPEIFIDDKTTTSTNFGSSTIDDDNVKAEEEDVFKLPQLPLSTITGDDSPQKRHPNENIAKSPCFKIMSSTHISVSDTADDEISIDSGEGDDMIADNDLRNLSGLETPGMMNNLLANETMNAHPFNCLDDGTKLLERLVESPLKIESELDVSSVRESAANGSTNVLGKADEIVQGSPEESKTDQQAYSGSANDTRLADRCLTERNNELEQPQSGESMISLSNEHVNENTEVHSKALGSSKGNQLTSASRGSHLPSVDSGFDSPEGISNPNEILITEHETNESQQLKKQTSTGPNSDSCCPSFANARQIHSVLEDCAISNDTMFSEIGTNSSEILNGVSVHSNEDAVFPNAGATGYSSNFAQDKPTDVVNLNQMKIDAKESYFVEEPVVKGKGIGEVESKLKCDKFNHKVDTTCSAQSSLENRADIKLTNETKEIATKIGGLVPKEITTIDVHKGSSQSQAQDVFLGNSVLSTEDGNSESTMGMDDDFTRVIRAYLKKNRKILGLDAGPASPLTTCSCSDDALTPSKLADNFVKSCERVTFSRLSTSGVRDSCKRDIIHELSSCDAGASSENNDLKSRITQGSGINKNFGLSGSIHADDGATKAKLDTCASPLINGNMLGETEVRKSGAHRAWDNVETDVLYGDWMSNKSTAPNEISNRNIKSNASKLAAKIFKGTDTSSSTFDNNLFANCSGKILKEETSQLTSDEIRQRLKGVGRMMNCKTQNNPLGSKSDTDSNLPAARSVFSSKLNTRPCNLVQSPQKAHVPGITRPSGKVISAPNERHDDDVIPSFQGSRTLQKSKLGQSHDGVASKFRMTESTVVRNTVKSRNQLMTTSKKIADVKIVPPQKAKAWEQILEECVLPTPHIPTNISLSVESNEAKTPREKINAAWGALDVNKPIIKTNVKPMRTKRRSMKNEIHNGPIFTFHKIADEKAKKRDPQTTEIRPKEGIPQISFTGSTDDQGESGSRTNAKARKRDPQTAEVEPKETVTDISNACSIDGKEECGSQMSAKAKTRDPPMAEVNAKERVDEITDSGSIDGKYNGQQRSFVTLESERILREVKLDSMIPSDANSFIEAPDPLVQFSSIDLRKINPKFSTRKRKLEPPENPKQVKRSRNQELIYNPTSGSTIASFAAAEAAVKCVTKEQASAYKNLAHDGTENAVTLEGRQSGISTLAKENHAYKEFGNVVSLGEESCGNSASKIIDSNVFEAFTVTNQAANTNVAFDNVHLTTLEDETHRLSKENRDLRKHYDDVTETNLESELEQSLLRAENLLVKKKKNPFLTIDMKAIGGLSHFSDSSTTDTSESTSSSDSDDSMLEKKIEEKKAYYLLLQKEIRTVRRRIKMKINKKGRKFRLKKQDNKPKCSDSKGRSFMPMDLKYLNGFKDIPPFKSKLFRRNCAFSEVGKKIKYFRRRRLVVQLTNFRTIGTKGKREKCYYCEHCCRTFEMKPCVVSMERCTSHPIKFT